MPDRGPITVAGVEGLGAGDGPIFAVIGVFDGIHLGHRYLLRHLDVQAERRGARSAVITFDAHPDEVILGAAPPLLLDPDERLHLLGEAGVEVVVVQHFDAALRVTEYDEFIHRIMSRTRLAGLLMTPDAAFGHDRRGTPETVAALGAHHGFDLVVVPPYLIDGRPVRSSDIRAAIAAGDLDEAATLLGRPYAISGRLIESRLVPALPMATPPVGASYRATIEVRGERHPVMVAVDASAAIVVDGPPSPTSGAPATIVFESGAR